MPSLIRRIGSPGAIAVLLLVIGSRLFLVARMHEAPLVGDEVAYDTLGRNLATGQGYTFPPALLYPWQQASGANLATARRPPLYPVMLAAGYRLGLGHRGIRIVQVFLAALTIGLVYHIALAVGLPERAALLAMLALAIDPPFLGATLSIATEALFLPLLALGVLAFLRAIRGAGFAPWIVSGVALGLAGLTRPITYLLPLVLLPFAPRGRRGAARWLALVLAMAVTVSPWVIRNARVFGVFEPTYSHSGFNFFLGTSDRQIDTPLGPDIQDAIRGMDEFAADRWYARRGMENLRHDPVHFVRLMGLKLAEAWFAIDLSPQPHVSSRSAVAYGLALLLTVIGFVLLVRSGRPLRWLLPALAAYFLLILTLAISGLRLSLPVILFCSPAMGLALHRLLGGSTNPPEPGPRPA